MKSPVGFFGVFICCAFLLSASGLEEGTPVASPYYLGQEPPGDTAALFAPGIKIRGQAKFGREKFSKIIVIILHLV